MNYNNVDDLKKDPYSAHCPMQYALNMVGGKWKIPILWELFRNETVRFNELKRSVHGITNTMLSNSLQELQDDRLVQRVQYNEMPLRVEYSLSDGGKGFLPVLLELSKWGLEQMKVREHNCIDTAI